MFKHPLAMGLVLSVGLVGVRPVHAQHMSVDRELVAPGTAVTVTLSGVPGQHYAVVAVPVGAGLLAFGVPLKLGTDYVILGFGVLNASGDTAVTIAPPFWEPRSTITLDRASP